MNFSLDLLHRSNSIKRIVLIDLRNHGISDHHNSMKFEEMAEDLIRHLNKIKVDKFILMGHSIGAKISMLISMKCPNKINSLIILDTYPLDYTDYPKIYTHMKENIEFLLTIDLNKFKEKSEVIKFIEDNLVNKIIFLLC